jgi:hypothetical protein
MNRMLAATAVVVALLGTPASAHRLDEYLQATLILVEKDHVEVLLRLTPGIAVSSVVLAGIDSNADGVISETEKRAYAERVLGDLSLTVDGHRSIPRLVSVELPEIEEMKEGLGEIRIAFTAALPSGGRNRQLIFENHHQHQIAAYQVNCLTPRDRDIRVTAQNRNEDQSFYRLDYVQAAELEFSEPLQRKWWPGVRGWPGASALSLFAGIMLLSVILLSRQVLIAIFRGARKALG